MVHPLTARRAIWTPFPLHPTVRVAVSLSVIIGVSIGAVVLLAAVIVVLVKRNRKKAEPTAPDHDDAHHVAEQSSAEVVEAVTTAKSEETQCADTVHAMEVVVEEAAPKESEAVSAEQ